MRTKAGWVVAAVVAAVAAVAVAGCSGPTPGPRSSADSTTSKAPVPTSPTTGRPTTAPAVPLGSGLVAFPNDTERWVRAHPDDPRTPLIARTLADKPTSLWLTGDESFGNLREYAQKARAVDGTMVLVLWNVPQRWDGLTEPSGVTLADYRRWVSRVAAGIGDTRAVVVLEPDALWFYDRLPDDAQRADRLAALRFAVAELGRRAPNARVYVEAGTASGSVTPQRMAELVRMVGVDAYAVNVSSYAPAARIDEYAQQIRAGLQRLGASDPRYLVDTGRNGAQSWDNTWCNPTQQRVGEPPGAVASTSGQDLRLWVKPPGTSAGDCGPPGAGAGSEGGEFLPDVAYRMIS